MTRRSRAARLVAAALVAVGAAGAASATTQSSFSAASSNAGNSIAADTLDAPTGLSAGGTTTVELTWTATVDDYATGHKVYRATSAGGPYTEIASVTPATTTSHSDNPGTGTFYYVVRAYHQSWLSAASNEASASR